MRCIQQSRIARVKSISKGKSKSLSHLIHLTDPSSIKQQSLYECGFSRVNMGRDTNISDFDTSFGQKKETLLQMYTAMPIEQIDSGLAWSVFLSTMIIHYHSGQHLLQTHAAQPGE